MIIAPAMVGIDISKDHLDVFDGTTQRGWRTANDAAALRLLLGSWKRAGAFVLFEATDPYDRALREALASEGITFSRVNPLRARDFARAAGFLAKTDQVDARMLAAMASALRPAGDPPPDPERDRLAGLHKRRDQLVAARKAERTRSHTASDPEIAASIAAHITFLDQSIAALEDAIAAFIKASPKLARRDKLLRSLPGIGRVNAATLLALAPELGQRSPKQIAALAGLAPLNKDSGRFRGKRSITGGRKRLRDALYLAAVTAARSKTRFAVFYRALRAAGKPPKLALIALARKLLVTLNAIARENIPFKA